MDLSKEQAKIERAKWARIGAWAQWVVTLATALALIFTLRHGSEQLAATREHQVTNRFAAAVNQVGSKTTEVRVGGVYALGRLMKDSPTDQGTIVDVLAAFVRDRQHPQINTSPPPDSYYGELRIDIEGAIVTLQRWCQRNGSCVRLEGDEPLALDLSGVKFGSIDWEYNLPGADFFESNFSDAFILGADLSGGTFIGANMRDSFISEVDLQEASFFDADLSGVEIESTDLTKADLERADLQDSSLRDANLSGANLDDANLRGADLSKARVSCGQLAKADMDETTTVPDSCSGTRS
ncbi:pentapeptide repeat-containing protein [Streptomyces sp. NPDC126510]|uniref:pentapeptide repeat-containing protein n=1 Tax=Streptomyces sp. NPDC126510 TaxID=3155317 RepID=UPI0033262F64